MKVLFGKVIVYCTLVFMFSHAREVKVNRKSILEALRSVIEDRSAWPPQSTKPWPQSTKPPGCYDDNGKYYPPGSQISKGEDRESNWCFGSYCSYDGQVLQWDNFNCYPTPTTTPSSAPPPTSPPSTTSPTDEPDFKSFIEFLRKMIVYFRSKNDN